MAVYEQRGSATRGCLLRVFETDPDGVVVAEETELADGPFDAT